MILRHIIRILIWSYLIKFIIRWIIGISYRINPKDLKNKNQYIFVANHNSHLDTASILSALPISHLQNTYPVAAADYFGKTKFTRFLSHYLLNALLIKRNKDQEGENPIDQMDSLLKKGKSLIIFPEGSRGGPEQMQPFKKGIGILLEKNPHIPFVPIYLDGMGKALPKGDGILVPFIGSINFSTPVLIPQDLSADQIVSIVQKEIESLAKRSSI